MKINFDTAVCSCRGGRNYNEDNVQFLFKGNCGVVMVADGLGGLGGGEIASAAVTGTVINGFIQSPNTDAENLRLLFERANQAVLDARKPGDKMKSTGAALFLHGDTYTWGHVGDSRLYRFENGVLADNTLDHSVSQMAVLSGEITHEQIRHHADRNKVLRAFGDENNFRPEIAEVKIFEPGFYAFLLCSDGFWEYVSEAEMEIELAKAATPHDWIQGMIQRLARRVPEDNDNFSAAAVFIKAK